ncbi:hypothetical protein M0813_22733 [Anaeramoeba flamelloides]|uniref:EF-hand domain-containing protein n=1 Tax=Anaeramoeba flamelloides TaxID=1746091 RepID=A0ABQ8YCJ4_9EUKA|nr:hypothetical protein M0813_22733 [Anaeramoeba flamelloides]
MITIAAHLKKDESIDNYTGYLKFLDENDNGTIYASELKYALKNTGEKMTEKEIEQIFQQLEISNEGSINIQEFLQKIILK